MSFGRVGVVIDVSAKGLFGDLGPEHHVLVGGRDDVVHEQGSEAGAPGA